MFNLYKLNPHWHELLKFVQNSQCQPLELATLGFAKFIFRVFALKRTSFRSVIKKSSWVTFWKGVSKYDLKCWIHLHIARRLLFLFSPHFTFSFLFFTLLFFLPLLLLFVLNQVLCLKDQTTILLIHFEPNLSEHSLFAQHTRTFSLLKTTKYIFKHLYEGTY